MLDGLREAGWRVPDAQGNFVWFGWARGPSSFAAACREAGRLVRPFAGEGPGSTIGEPEANDRFIEVAAAFSHM